MNHDGPNNTNGSSELAQRLKHLRTLASFTNDIGQQATNAFIKTQTILGKEVRLPAKATDFIRTITSPSTSNRRISSTADIEQLVEHSNEELASASTVFPLEFFPDTITLDRTKLTVTRRDFFFTSDVMSIRIEDILNVTSYVGPFFGALTIATRVLSSDDHFTIRHLWRQDAIHLKHMIQGYIIAKQNNLDCEDLSRDELVSLLRDLGHDSHKDPMSIHFATPRPTKISPDPAKLS